MQTGDEIVTIVDQDNREIGRVSRRVMRRDGLIHRATYILVFNRADDIFVQKRTVTKDIYPGYYDVATGGVVLAGESYEVSAARELAEELGVRGAKLSSHFDFYHQDAGNRVWGRLFTCTAEGPFTLQASEVEDGFFLPVAEVLAMSDKEAFTPDGIMVLKRFLQAA
ncbi:MAG: NUDIX hydrolase YfcD [Thermodesulfobacteriota bacterium]